MHADHLRATRARTSYAAAILLAMIGAGSSSCQLLLDPQTDAELTVEPDADPGKRTKVTALGRLVPESEIVDVGAPVGRIQRLLVAEGSRVKQGEILGFLRGFDGSLKIVDYRYQINQER